MNICGVILAGGKSSRMGKDKALLHLENRTVIERIVDELSKVTDEVVIITNDLDNYRFLNLPIVSDRYQEKGPLGGFETAMYHSSADCYVFSACDTPFINYQIYQLLLAELSNHDAVVPKYNNRLHPLSGVYKYSSLPVIQEQIAQNKLKVKSFFDRLNTKYIDDFSGVENELLKGHFFNMNTPDEYNAAKGFKFG